MPGWALWIIAAALLAIGEVATPGLFFLGPVALGAAAAALAAALAGEAAALIVFVVVCILGLALLRPIARRHLRMPAATRTGVPALVGADAVVLTQVDRTGGRVKIRGEEWSARAFLYDETMEPGEHVEVVQIDGATALVV